jgi:heme/copper-type cytochrome/quinol oxidase subunit 1
MMAVVYYLIPRMMRRNIKSVFLGQANFYFMVSGVLLFYVTLLVFGILEGNRMLDEGIVYPMARAHYEPIHRIGFVFSALLMGLAHWTFVANIFWTYFAKESTSVIPDAVPAKERA